MQTSASTWSMDMPRKLVEMWKEKTFGAYTHLDCYLFFIESTTCAYVYLCLCNERSKRSCRCVWKMLFFLVSQFPVLPLTFWINTKKNRQYNRHRFRCTSKACVYVNSYSEELTQAEKIPLCILLEVKPTNALTQCEL